MVTTVAFWMGDKNSLAYCVSKLASPTFWMTMGISGILTRATELVHCCEILTHESRKEYNMVSGGIWCAYGAILAPRRWSLPSPLTLNTSTNNFVHLLATSSWLLFSVYIFKLTSANLWRRIRRKISMHPHICTHIHICPHINTF